MDERRERRDVPGQVAEGDRQRLRGAIDKKSATFGRRDVFYYR